MNTLWFYDFLYRRVRLSYPNKILAVAFIGTHIPLLALIGFFVVQASDDLGAALRVMGVALLATLAGTGATLFVLHHLLRPILLTSRALRRYSTSRELPDLPTGYTDEAGMLMSDAAHTLRALDGALNDVANYDKVTGLSRRDRFIENLAARLRGKHGTVVAVASIDNLGSMASALGQDSADALTRQVATALSRSLPPKALTSRLGSNLFAFALGGSDAASDLEEHVRVTLAALTAGFERDGLIVTPQARLGVAASTEGDADAAALVDQALSAIGNATPTAVGRVSYFSPAAREALRRRFLLEQELRRAIDRDEFFLDYQPVVDTGLGAVVGAEALIRWRHPERGLVSPGEFIPAAERSEQISAIGYWVLREACRQLAEWSDGDAASLRVAINLSARQFLDPRIVPSIAEALRDNCVDATRLEIELTETAVMVDHAYTKAVFGKIRDLGATVAIDDFGTGQSSMSYLKRLDFDKLKIDREFVAGVDASPDGQAICRAMVELSRGLNLQVLAEGVETESEVATLRSVGCELFQGFYFSRPLAARAFRTEVAGLGIASRIMRSVAA